MLFRSETGEDIGMGSPVPLSQEAVGVITRLRNMKVIQTALTVYHIDLFQRMKTKTGVAGETLYSAPKVS